MTLQERLRRNALKNGGGASHELHKAAHEAADALDTQEKRIKELEGALREVLDAMDGNEGHCPIDTYDRAREVLNQK
jgi:hypothetical protein